MKRIVFLILILSLAIDYNILAQEINDVDSSGFIIQIGQKAPDFLIEYHDGRSPEKLSDLNGQVVLLQFTASWCGVCRREMPYLERDIWQVFKNDKFRLIGITRMESPKKALEFEKKMGISYPLISDETDEIFTLYAHPQAGVTRNVLINKHGTVILMTRLFNENTIEDLVTKIKQNLN